MNVSLRQVNFDLINRIENDFLKAFSLLLRRRYLPEHNILAVYRRVKR